MSLLHEGHEHFQGPCWPGLSLGSERASAARRYPVHVAMLQVQQGLGHVAGFNILTSRVLWWLFISILDAVARVGFA